MLTTGFRYATETSMQAISAKETNPKQEARGETLGKRGQRSDPAASDLRAMLEPR
jgi:hypothetical protein